MKNLSEIAKVYLFLAVATIPMIALVLFDAKLQKEQTILEAEKILDDTLEGNERTLSTFIRLYEKSLTSLATSNYLIELLAGNSQENRSFIVEEIKRLQSIQWGNSHHIFVTDSSGNVIISPDKENGDSSHLGSSLSSNPSFNSSSKKSYLSDFHSFSETDHFHQLLIIPILFEDRTIGNIVAELQISKILELISAGLTDKQSSEVFLLGSKFKKVTQDKKAVVETESNELTKTLSQQNQASGDVEINGKIFTAVYKKSPDFPWILGVHINQDLLHSKINKNIAIQLLGLIIAVVLFFIVVYRAFKIIKAPIENVSSDFTLISNRLQNNSKSMLGKSKKLLEDSTELSSSVVKNKDQLDAVCELINNDNTKVDDALTTSKRCLQNTQKGQNSIVQVVDSMTKLNEFNRGMIDKFLFLTNKVVEISHSVKTVESKVNLINDIVFQTKLLSFNASVEAARAGESGKGFSVVAEEIGKLAAMSGKSAVEINSIVKTSLEKTEVLVKEIQGSIEEISHSSELLSAQTVTKITESKNVFTDIFNDIDQLHHSITEVSNGSESKMRAISEVSSRFGRLQEIANTASKLANENQESSASHLKDSNNLILISDRLKKDFAA